MSARMLLELLAGKLTVDEFEQNYQMNPAQNPFRIMLQRGRLIEQIVVEPHPDKDDDRVRIHFGSPDVAVAPFKCE